MSNSEHNITGSGVKIQINSLQALERLIGGDSNLEIQIRGSIVQEFVTKYLKGIVEHKLVDAAKNTVLHELSSQFLELTKENQWSDRKIVALNGQSRELILKFLKENISGLLQQLLEESPELNLSSLHDKVQESLKKIELQVDEAAYKIQRELSEKVLEKKLDEMVTARLKKSLGMK